MYLCLADVSTYSFCYQLSFYSRYYFFEAELTQGFWKEKEKTLGKFFNIRFRYIVFFRNLQRGLSLARWVAKHRPERSSPIHHNIICCAVVCVEIWELLPESMYLHMNDTLHEQLDSPLPIPPPLFFIFCCLLPALLVFLNCPLWIAPFIFSNVYCKFNTLVQVSIWKRKQYIVNCVPIKRHTLATKS